MSDRLPIWGRSTTHPLLEPETKPPFITGDWNMMTKRVFQFGSFVKAAIWRMKRERANAIIIEGELGEGKTNVLLYFLMYLNNHFNVPFSVENNVFLGRDVDLTINWIAKRFKPYPYSAIGIDESEVCFSRYQAHSIQNREAKIFMDTFRELKLIIFFVCPDKDILDQRIVDRCNWNIICDDNNDIEGFVDITIEYYAKTKDRTRFRWLEYEELRIPYVPQTVYNDLRRIKHADLYTDKGLEKDFHTTRKERMKDSKQSAKVIQAKRIQEIIDSKSVVNDKIQDMISIKVPLYQIEMLLKKEGATKSRIALMHQFWLTQQDE